MGDFTAFVILEIRTSSLRLEFKIEIFTSAFILRKFNEFSRVSFADIRSFVRLISYSIATSIQRDKYTSMKSENVFIP